MDWKKEKREREREREKRDTRQARERREKNKRNGLLLVLWQLPLTRCSSWVMTSTAWWSTVNLGCVLSILRCIWHMRPNSLNASFMSFTRTLTAGQEWMRHNRNNYVTKSNSKQWPTHRTFDLTQINSKHMYYISNENPIWPYFKVKKFPYRSRALLACLLSFSLTTLTAGSSPSSSSSSSSLPALLINPEVNGVQVKNRQKTTKNKNSPLVWLKKLSFSSLS